jgi:class 3 adenylate cyclase
VRGITHRWSGFSSESTKNAASLGQKLHEKRVQSFVTAAVAALGQFRPRSYSHFLKQTGDAVLMIFSCFDDLYDWWELSHKNFLFHSSETNRELEPKMRPLFQLRAKTVVHLGEISYQNRTDPISLAVNQVFKIEKSFGPGQLGATQRVVDVAKPFFEERGIEPKQISKSTLPGDEIATGIWLLAEHETANIELR